MGTRINCRQDRRIMARKRACAPLTKEAIRSRILRAFKIHKEEERKRKSRIIKRKLLSNPLFKKAKVVMFYISFGGEVKTKDMIKAALKSGKIVTVPVCTKDRERMIPCILTDTLGAQSKRKDWRHTFCVGLKNGLYGVYEPAVRNPIQIKELDLVIVPGLAFDNKGNRLGRGKGYYDRFLKKLPKKTGSIGLAYDFQILPAVPTTKRDIGVDQVIFA